MKKRSGDPWMPAGEFARTLKGAGFNLLTRNMARSLEFQRNVLESRVVYADEDFAAIEAYDSTWILHADHAYLDHPMHGIAVNADGRGAGVELRLYGLDPDAAATRARANDFIVLEDPADKAHGLRECFILDDDGYLWVPSVLTPD